MTTLRNTVTEPDGTALDGWLDVAAVGSPFRNATQSEVLGPIKDRPFTGGAWSVELVPGLYVITQRRRSGAFHSRWTADVPDSGSPVWLADCLVSAPSTPASMALLGIAATVVDEAGHLQITYTNGSTVDAGPVIGPEGPPYTGSADEFAEAMAGHVGDGSAFDLAQRAAFGLAGANLSRFIRRAQAGNALKLVALGDSVLEGQTVTNPAADDSMHLLPVDLGARFPKSTFTAVNYAVSGYTTAASFINGKVAAAVAEKADLYVLAFGKNDLAWERVTAGSLPVPGYPRAASIAMLEQMVRLIRAEVPKADIIILGENPYTPLSDSGNPLQLAWTDAARGVAAVHGCEFVDGYTPFATSATPLPTLVPDGTHPGTAGHRLLADTILDHLPASYGGPALAPTATTGGLYPQTVDTTTALRGWQKLTAPATGIWVNGGTGWAGTAPYVTSTAGDYAEFTFTGTELLVTLSTAAADAPVIDVTVDGAPLYTGRSLTSGKQGSAYLVPIATGLTAGVHTVRITLASGTLRITNAAMTVAGGAYAPSTVVVNLTGDQTNATVPTDGTVHYMVNQQVNAVPLPAGWSKMAVVFTGSAVMRVTRPTTTERIIAVRLRLGSTVVTNLQKTVDPTSGTGVYYTDFGFGHTEVEATTGIGVRLEAVLQSTDKTNVTRSQWELQAVCQRLA